MKTQPENYALKGNSVIQPHDIINDIDTLTKPSKSLLESLKIDVTEELPPPEVALRIESEIYGTLGNFSLLIGKAKSKKTFAVTMAMAGALGAPGKFEGCLPAHKNRVVFCDTEQSRYHVQKVAKRVLRLYNQPEIPDNFDVFTFRPVDTKTRLELIEEIINSTPDLGLLIIDGIRDVVTSINDEEQATDIANKLLEWTEKYGIHIITVLHQNKGDKNARGHLGTELINKAETTVSIEKENEDVSKVQAEYTRSKEFQPFGLVVNMHGLPEIVEGWKPKAESKAGHYKTSPDEIDDYKHQQILSSISSNADTFTNAELITQIKLAVKKQTKEPIGDTKAKEFKQWYLNENYIKHHGKARSPKAYYTIHPGKMELNDD